MKYEAQPLKKLCDASIKVGEIPQEWKTGIVTAIHKKDRKVKQLTIDQSV